MAQVGAQGLVRASSAARLSSSRTAVSALADLVVQLLGDAAPLGLLRGQRAGAAGAPVRVSSRSSMALKVRISSATSPLPVPAAVARDAADRPVAIRPRQPVERGEPDAQQDGVGGEPDRETGEENHAWAGTTGAETVTGANSNSAVAAASTDALSSKIRQNKDTTLGTSSTVTIPTIRLRVRHTGSSPGGVVLPHC